MRVGIFLSKGRNGLSRDPRPALLVLGAIARQFGDDPFQGGKEGLRLLKLGAAEGSWNRRVEDWNRKRKICDRGSGDTVGVGLWKFEGLFD